MLQQVRCSRDQRSRRGEGKGDRAPLLYIYANPSTQSLCCKAFGYFEEKKISGLINSKLPFICHGKGDHHDPFTAEHDSQTITRVHLHIHLQPSSCICAACGQTAPFHNMMLCSSFPVQSFLARIRLQPGKTTRIYLSPGQSVLGKSASESHTEQAGPCPTLPSRKVLFIARHIIIPLNKP